MTFREKTEHLFKLNHISEYATPEICDKLQKMLVRLQEVNAHTNLTAITEEDGILYKHIADSLKIAPLIPKNAKILDVGCGGGFPSLPLAIARPDISVTALDSTEKKVNYVKESAALLGLDNLSTRYGRAEDFAHDPTLRASFDVVTARAVAALPILCELCLPFVRQNGKFLAMKSGHVEQELSASFAGIELLGGKIETTAHFLLVSHENEVAPEARSIVVIQKTAQTPPAYPRPYAKIKKRPL